MFVKIRKLSAVVNKLNQLQDDLESISEDLAEIQEKIDDNAFDHNRDMTAKEEEKYESYGECISDIEDAVSDLMGVVDKLENYI